MFLFKSIYQTKCTPGAPLSPLFADVATDASTLPAHAVLFLFSFWGLIGLLGYLGVKSLIFFKISWKRKKFKARWNPWNAPSNDILLSLPPPLLDTANKCPSPKTVLWNCVSAIFGHFGVKKSIFAKYVKNEAKLNEIGIPGNVSSTSIMHFPWIFWKCATFGISESFLVMWGCVTDCSMTLNKVLDVHKNNQKVIRQ